MKQSLLFLFIFCTTFLFGQTTNIIMLDSEEIQNLREQIACNSSVKNLYLNILSEAKNALHKNPNPVSDIFYEGLLPTNLKRIKTIESFLDIDNSIQLIYASYGSINSDFSKKAKEIVLAWATTYKPTGNPINENKLNGLFWSYYFFKNEFSATEQKTVESWILEIATREKNRLHTPNNNWEAKRCKIIGIAGCILNNEELKRYSVTGFKKYIATAYYPDGTSNDLKQRDALSYHISGLKPCVSAFINLSKFDPGFELFDFVSPTGSSVKKSVEYVVPFATGKKQHHEWTNTTVQLDKERAAAGLEEYQPGKLFEPKKTYELFELACFYRQEWTGIFEKNKQIISWIGLLNQPNIRNE